MNDIATGMVLQTERENRARDWIRLLTDLPARFAGSAVERDAAERVAGWMRELGAGDVALVATPGAPRSGFVLALHAGVALLGCWIGGWFGAVLAVLAAWSFRREFRQHQPRLSKLLPSPESVNVVGRMGAPVGARRVVLSGHIDTTQAGWLFSRQLADTFASTATRLRRSGAPLGPLVLPEAIIMLAALVVVAAWLGAHGAVFGIAKGLVSLGLVVTCLVTLQWAMSPPTPGANDNASAVASMLTCAERLQAQLPKDVELWLVGTGAEEVGCRGMHGFLARQPGWSRDSTYFVNFECTGGGALHYICSEGLLHKVYYPPMLLDLARRVAVSEAFGVVTPTDLLAGTDGHVPAARGYPTLSLISLESNGVPRNYHRKNDTVDAIDTAMVVRAADFGAAVALSALRGAVDPVAPAANV